MAPASGPSFAIPILVLLAGTLPAQVVPFGLQNKEGSLHTVTFGLTPQAHYQFAEGGLRNKITSIRRISFRGEALRTVQGATFKSPGRSWTNVQVRLSNCDITKVSRTFATNSLSTPTLLFNAKVTWPDQPNTSQASPRPFEAGLSFPLTATYVSVGRQDLLLDFVFRGGTLKNNANWAQIPAQPYLLDAAGAIDVPFAQNTPTVVGNRNCKDPGAFFGPSGLDALVVAYRKQSGSAATNDTFVLTMRSRGTAPVATVVHAVGLNGGTGGAPVGACNRLYMVPNFMVPLLADGGGEASWRASTKYQQQVVGLALWFQAAWADSKTKAFSLTNAVTLKIPQQPPMEPRCYLPAFSATATTSASLPSFQPADLPVILYAAK